MPDSLPPQRRAWVLLAFAFAALGLRVVWGFLPALVWGVIIAVATDPLYRRAQARWPNARHALPAAFALGLLLLLLIPLGLALVQAPREAQSLSAWIAEARSGGIPLPGWTAQLPFGREALATWWSNALATPGGAASWLHRFDTTALAHSRSFGAALLRRLTTLLFALVTLFFLLLDRDRLVREVDAVGDRLFGAAGERVARQLLLSVQGTINGLVLVGLAEGAVLGVAYFFLGIPHPLLLGAATGVAAMIPLGAVIVFVLAALLLLVQGAPGAAIALVAIGFVVIAIADHVVRPVLIGGATKLPFLWVLIGILGGVEAFGLLGLFVGPATMAVLIMLWRDYVADAVAPSGDAMSPPRSVVE